MSVARTFMCCLLVIQACHGSDVHSVCFNINCCFFPVLHNSGHTSNENKPADEPMDIQVNAKSTTEELVCTVPCMYVGLLLE